MTTTTTTDPPRPPDRPEVPRPKFAKASLFFAVIGSIIVVGYSAIAFTGYEPLAPKRAEVPASFRSSPGGYRTFHFWHSGYHGGK